MEGKVKILEGNAEELSRLIERHLKDGWNAINSIVVVCREDIRDRDGSYEGTVTLYAQMMMK